jgi:hypothetical protein
MGGTEVWCQMNVHGGLAKSRWQGPTMGDGVEWEMFSFPSFFSVFFNSS